MRVESITIEHLRGIRGGSLTHLGDVNLLVERNNSGKSTVVEALLLLAHHAAEGRANPLGYDRLHRCALARNESRGHLDTLWYQEQTGAPIAVVAKLTRGEARVRIARPRPGHTTPTFAGDPAHLRDATAFTPSDATNKALEQATWRETLTHRGDRHLARAVGEIFDLDIEGVQLPPDGRLTLLTPERGVLVDSMGDGTRAAIRCLLVLSTLKNTVFIIEEPECHQHPTSLARLATAVCRQARRDGVQLFITTHSLECVRDGSRRGRGLRRAPPVARGRRAGGAPARRRSPRRAWIIRDRRPPSRLV